MPSTPRRTVLALVLAATSLILATGSVTAHATNDGLDGHRGRTGRHAFIDSADRPGARCVYRDVAPVSITAPTVVTAELVRVGVRPPRVAAIDRTDRVDFGRVGWRFILQEKIGSGDWTNVMRSPLQMRRTSDRRAARFSRMAVRYDGNPDAQYRVKTKAFWFGRRHRRIGMAFHVVNFYRVGDGIVEAACEGSLAAAP